MISLFTQFIFYNSIICLINKYPDNPPVQKNADKCQKQPLTSHTIKPQWRLTTISSQSKIPFSNIQKDPDGLPPPGYPCWLATHRRWPRSCSEGLRYTGPVTGWGTLGDCWGIVRLVGSVWLGPGKHGEIIHFQCILINKAGCFFLVMCDLSGSCVPNGF